jgi:hypothetical protein
VQASWSMVARRANSALVPAGAELRVIGRWSMLAQIR